MVPEDALAAFAEIGIGLAGFSGLVAAFVQHAGDPWREDQKARIVLLIVMSFGMIVCALLPYALAGISDAAGLVWGLPMVLFSTLCLGLLVHWALVARSGRFKLHFPWISIPVLVLAGGLQVLSLLSGLGVVLPYSPTIFLLGFLSLLVFGALVFVALLNSIWN
ncbi:hypothetical protein [Haliea sp. E17]|uniref:hypothetical protein n=1 Tax=Haliea sp. E17 TaxID=3401576 RepID=UPI003AACD140